MPTFPKRLVGLAFLGCVLLGATRALGSPDPVEVTFPVWRFGAEEGWSLQADGAAGRSELRGRMLRLDFSQGAQAFMVRPPDRVIPGTVRSLQVRVYGSVEELPVRLTLRTHFMSFHRSLGHFDGNGHLELETAGPPGLGWDWSGGENDGKLHGPLRLGELRFLRPPNPGVVELELEEILVTAVCPPQRRCLVAASMATSDAEQRFQFEGRALAESVIPASLRWEVRDWDGGMVASGAERFEFSTRAEPVRFAVPIRAEWRQGRRFLECEFRVETADREQETAPVRAAWVAPVEEPGSAELRPDSPFGMGAYLYRYPNSPEGFAEMDRAAEAARRAGVKWSREEFQWHRIEPVRGRFEWEFFDRLVATAKRQGIQVYAIVAYWSHWTRPYTPEGIDDYVRYLEALVRRYRDDIRHWEIWNEPNIFFWQGPKDLYADLLKKSYAAVKAIDPDAQVLGLSTAGIDFDYIRRMLELEAPFDILTIHPYRRVLDDQAFLSDLRRVADLVKPLGGPGRPVWLTELGWSTYQPHNTQAQDFAPTALRTQAELLVRCYLLAMGSGIHPRTFWYNFRNDGEDPFYFEHQMGILYRDFQPKPAYRAFAVMTSLLEGLTEIEPLDLGAGILAWSFTQPTASSRRVIALWNPSVASDVRIPALRASAVLVNAMGETRVLSASEGYLTVPLRAGAPVYVAGD